jgi:hypothetical protein
MGAPSPHRESRTTVSQRHSSGVPACGCHQPNMLTNLKSLNETCVLVQHQREANHTTRAQRLISGRSNFKLGNRMPYTHQKTPPSRTYQREHRQTFHHSCLLEYFGPSHYKTIIGLVAAGGLPLGSGSLSRAMICRRCRHLFVNARDPKIQNTACWEPIKHMSPLVYVPQLSLDALAAN